MNNEQLNQAILCLKAGGIIAYPTESVYGLGCDANNLQAVARILKIKRRDSNKGLILLVSDIQQASQFIQPLDHVSATRLSQPLEHATTWLLPKSPKTSSLVVGEHSSIAIRITTHPIARALCQGFGAPIVSTSCNLNAEPPSSESGLIPDQLAAQLDFILEGDCGGHAPSIIVDYSTGKRLR